MGRKLATLKALISGNASIEYTENTRRHYGTRTSVSYDGIVSCATILKTIK
jgi:hypothetical protein